MQIIHTSPSDLAITFLFFRSAVDYQKKNGYQLWPEFDEKMILNEMEEKRHWKILEGNEIIAVFSVMYNDPVIWGKERDEEPSVYLHRIAVNPQQKGKRVMESIRDWALEHAKQNHKKFVRMDTWGDNETLRNYYIKCGFKYIGQCMLEHTEGLPGHYGGSHLSLFENKVD